MSYEKAILIPKQGTVKIRVLKDGIELEIYSPQGISVPLLIPPLIMEKVQEAIDTALCYFGEKDRG